MRVISGKLRGMKLSAPKGLTTRPTDDMLKENIFNLIGPIKKDSRVLDLFAGSGQIGIEFISRGSNDVVFVDKDFSAIKSIKSNMEKIDFINFKIIKSDVFKYLKNYTGQAFDYIYIDPPYDDTDFLEKILEFYPKSDIINKDTCIIFETIKSYQEESDKYKIIKSREYGKRKVIILKVNDESDISGEL